MPLPPDTRPPAPLPPDLLPLTDYPDVESAATEAVRRFTTPPPNTRRITEPVARAAMPKFMPPGAEHRDVLGSEGRVAYWSWGDPSWPLVVCLHGWGGRGTQWSPVATALLALRHRVVVLDAPAHGVSIERVVSTIYQVAADNPEILECTPASIVMARPVLTSFLNGVVANLWPFNYLCLTYWIVARLQPQPLDEQSVSVICPCRNEEGHIGEIVRRMPTPLGNFAGDVSLTINSQVTFDDRDTNGYNVLAVF